ncbi:hypothetical protein [uncultured Tenacibaculum sp.]|uniref:hypothetical protein n=1 Tax=uncultured Tenacibaculum sp. TaxID=174713 RepID=UPI002607F5E6|nr:hypothetical protein [uncultured Tenacibaculum sp.]
MKRIIVFILFTSIFCGCKSQKIKNSIISNPDEFSNTSSKEDFNTYLNYLANQKNLKSIKVLYDNKILGFENFRKKIGFNEKQNIDIIKDSIIISKYDVKDCKVLILVKDK